MTTPGGQLTPGNFPNEGDPPQFGVPEGAFVGEASSPQAITDLNNLNEAEIDRRQSARVAQIMGSSFDQQFGALGFFVQSILGILQGAVNLVVGTVQAVVDGIKGIINSIGSLFGAARVDTAAVDAARVAGENAIVARMSDSLDQLDEIQRFGGAFMGYETYAFDNGERNAHIVPLTDAIPLSAGTSMIPPTAPLAHSSGYRYPGYNVSQREQQRGNFARGSGQLELLESGLWLIDFQVAVLQGNSFTDQPVDAWCHVTPADNPYIPEGPPEVAKEYYDASFYRPPGDPIPGLQESRHRVTGEHYRHPIDGFIAPGGYGRAGSYVGVTDTPYGGGNTVSGRIAVYLETGYWKVTLSCNSWVKQGGAMSTYVHATKVNSETLRQDIDLLKGAIADSLPGENVPLDLDEAAIQAMVGQASEIEVPDVEVPNE